MNSILQILIHTRQFVEDMIVIDSDNNIKPITISLNSIFKNILIDKEEIIKGDINLLLLFLNIHIPLLNLKKIFVNYILLMN